MGKRGFKKGKKDAQPDKMAGVNMSGPTRAKEQIIREMVFETAALSFRKNKLFVVKRDGQDLYVGAYMPFEVIGGLSVKDKNDESKGSIINLINSGGMKTLFTAQLAAEDAIIFIPDAETLNLMSEYTLLAETAVYTLCLIDPGDESIEMTPVKVNWKKMSDMQKNGTSAATLLGDFLEDTHLDDEEEPQVLEAVAEGDGEDPTLDDQGDEGLLGDEGMGGDSVPDEGMPPDEPEEGFENGDEMPESDGEEPVEFVGAEGDLTGEESEGSGVEEAFTEDAPPEEEPPVEEEPGEVYIDPETASRALARRFFNSDLTRTLDTAGLDQMLEAKAAFRPLEKRAVGWLDEQVNVLIDLANQELFGLHQQNLTVVRQGYLDIMGAAYEEEMRAVTHIEEDERYGGLKKLREAREEELPGLVRQEREKLSEEWENKVKAAGEAARVAAEQTHRERFGRQHEEQLRNVEYELSSGMQIAFEKAVSELRERRRKEAETALDKLDTEQINAAMERYAKLAEAEETLLKKHQEKILAFLAEYRDAEIARINVLAEEQVRNDKIQKLEAEYQNRVASLQKEFDARVSALNQDLEALRVRHAAEMEAKDADTEALQRRHNGEQERLQGRIDKLLEDYAHLDEAKDAQYQARLTETASERDAFERQYDHMASSQKKINGMMVTLIIIGLIASLAVGFLGGQWLTRRQDTASQQAELMQQFVISANQVLNSDVPEASETPAAEVTPNVEPTEDVTADNTAMPSESPVNSQAPQNGGVGGN